MATMIAIEYVLEDGIRESFTTVSGSEAHRRALADTDRGVCVVVEEIEFDEFVDDGIPW